MKDRYLFRGKRVDNGEWVYGFWFTDALKRSWIVFGKLEHRYDYECYEVIPETVGQFTGLLDDNGKKIFEGDILLRKFDDGSKSTHVVIWRNQGFEWCSPLDFKLFNEKSSFATSGYIRECGKCEIIGNIHDNAALLEVEK